jgi:hypothetical protein
MAKDFRKDIGVIARHLKLMPDIMGVPDREFDRVPDQTIRIVKP